MNRKGRDAMKKRLRLPVLVISLLFLFVANMWHINAAEAEKSPSAEPAAPARVSGKDEAVFARLSAEGTVEGIYVVNHFQLSDNGEIIDYGNYSSAVNLTDLEEILLNDSTVKVRTLNKSFYYQGNLANNDLPWKYKIEYRLDGAVVKPEKLAGLSGRLELRLKSLPNKAIDSAFYENYMQQITITLDNDSCVNIRAEGASVANAGKNRILVFSVFPGKDADIRVTADVTDFEMEGIDITAIPLSMNFDTPDFDDMLDDFTLLSDAINELNDGIGELYEGMKEISSGAAELKDGSSTFKDGLSALETNSTQIISASQKIKKALSLMSSSLNSTGGIPDMSSLVQLPAALAQLADGLDGISIGIDILKSGYEQAYSALSAAIDGIAEITLSDSVIYSLYAKTGGDAEETALLNGLMDNYTAAMTVKGTFNATKDAFDSVSPALETFSSSLDSISGAIRYMSSEMETMLSGSDLFSQLGLLSSGLTQLSKNYSEFHKGLSAFMDGVSDINSGYVELDKGISAIGSGLFEITDGISEIYDGTGKMADETSDIPDRIKEEIDSFVEDFSGGKFEPVSFASGKNKNIEIVQFILKTDGIQKTDTETGAEAEQKQPGFWDRVIELFG